MGGIGSLSDLEEAIDRLKNKWTPHNTREQLHGVIREKEKFVDDLMLVADAYLRLLEQENDEHV